MGHASPALCPRCRPSPGRLANEGLFHERTGDLAENPALDPIQPGEPTCLRVHSGDPRRARGPSLHWPPVQRQSWPLDASHVPAACELRAGGRGGASVTACLLRWPSAWLKPLIGAHTRPRLRTALLAVAVRLQPAAQRVGGDPRQECPVCPGLLGRPTGSRGRGQGDRLPVSTSQYPCHTRVTLWASSGKFCSLEGRAVSPHPLPAASSPDSSSDSNAFQPTGLGLGLLRPSPVRLMRTGPVFFPRKPRHEARGQPRGVERVRWWLCLRWCSARHGARTPARPSPLSPCTLPRPGHSCEDTPSRDTW